MALFPCSRLGRANLRVHALFRRPGISAIFTSHSPIFYNNRMDRLAALRVFVAVAEAGSLSAAGRKLGMPLSTVSRQLKALEEGLDTRLITRTTRRLVLTEAGRS